MPPPRPVKKNNSSANRKRGHTAAAATRRSSSRSNSRGANDATPVAAAAAASSLLPLSPPPPPAPNAAAVFGALRDADFFSNKVQHVYMYSDVTNESVAALKEDIRRANRLQQAATPAALSAALSSSSPGLGEDDAAGGVLVADKPIVIHINSRGGSVNAALTMMSVFTESRLPICAMVDGYSASAATLLSVLAPYRVMTKYAACLIHEWWMERAENNETKKSEWEFLMEYMGRLDRHIDALFLRRTKLKRAELDALNHRDKLLDARHCLRYGLVDRVVDPVAPSPGGKRDGIKITDARRAAALLRSPNINHVYFRELPDTAMSPSASSAGSSVRQYNLAAVRQIDRFLRQGSAATNAAGNSTMRPVVVHCSGTFPANSPMMQVYPVATRLEAIPAQQVVGVVNTMVGIYNFLPVLFCKQRIMYDTAMVIIHVVYHNMGTWMMQDIIDNTALQHETLKAVLRARTKLPADIIDNLHLKRFALDAAQCLRYGLVDVVLPTAAV